METDEWTTVDRKQKKLTKQQQRLERKKQEQIEEEKRRAELELFTSNVPIEAPSRTPKSKKKKKVQNVSDQQEPEEDLSADFQSVLQEKKDAAKRKQHQRELQQQLQQQRLAAQQKQDWEDDQENRRQHQYRRGDKEGLGVAGVKDLVSLEEIDQEILEAKQKFPTDGTAQLVHITDFLDLHKGFSERYCPFWYPLDLSQFSEWIDTPLCSALSTEVQNRLSKWTLEFNQTQIIPYFWSLLAQYFQESNESGTMALKLILQLITRKFGLLIGKTILKEIEQKYLTLSSNSSPSPSTPLPGSISRISDQFAGPFIWLFAQTIHDTPQLALAYYYRFIVPLLCDPATPLQIIDLSNLFIEHLFQHRFPALQKSKVTEKISCVAVEKLLVLSVRTKNPSLKKTLEDIMPKLKEISIFFNKESPRHFFALLLAHATHKDQTCREQTLEILTSMLLTDASGCIEVWRTIYPKYIAHSNNLLLYILLNLSRFQDQVPNKEIMNLVEFFLTTNRDLGGNPNVDPQDAKMCTITCKAIQRKLSPRRPIPWRYILFTTVIGILLGYFYHEWNPNSPQQLEHHQSEQENHEL